MALPPSGEHQAELSQGKLNEDVVDNHMAQEVEGGSVSDGPVRDVARREERVAIRRLPHPVGLYGDTRSCLCSRLIDGGNLEGLSVEDLRIDCILILASGIRDALQRPRLQMERLVPRLSPQRGSAWGVPIGVDVHIAENTQDRDTLPGPQLEVDDTLNDCIGGRNEGTCNPHPRDFSGHYVPLDMPMAQPKAATPAAARTLGGTSGRKSAARKKEPTNRQIGSLSPGSTITRFTILTDNGNLIPSNGARLSSGMSGANPGNGTAMRPFLDKASWTLASTLSRRP